MDTEGKAGSRRKGWVQEGRLGTGGKAACARLSLQARDLKDMQREQLLVNVPTPADRLGVEVVLGLRLGWRLGLRLGLRIGLRLGAGYSHG